MLLWINGPFGGGKTQTASELHRRLPGSIICDPEQVGFGLHRTLPPELRGDFQDLQSWRDGVSEVLDLALTHHAGTVIAPMTVVDPTYFRETVGRLRDRGHHVRHVALLAERATVVRRLRERSLGRLVQLVAGEAAALRSESFAMSKLDLCLERLVEPTFAEQLWTDDLTVAEVAEEIATSAGLRLSPNHVGPLRGRLRRTWTSVRHIRLS